MHPMLERYLNMTAWDHTASWDRDIEFSWFIRTKEHQKKMRAAPKKRKQEEDDEDE